MSEHNIKQNN